MTESPAGSGSVGSGSAGAGSSSGAPPLGHAGHGNGTRQQRRALLWGIWTVAALGVGWLQLDVSAVGRAPATIDGAEVAAVAPRAARVQKVLVRPGDVVAQGTPLAELATAEVDLEIAVAEAELARLRSAVDAAVLDLRGADFEAGGRMEQDADRAAADLQTLQTDEKRDRAELDTVEALLKKQRELVDKKLASAEQRDQLDLRRAALAESVADAAAAIAAARARAERAHERLAEWKKAHTSAVDDARTGPERAGVQAQEERLRQLKAEREALTLRAPLTGRVSAVLVVEGTVLGSGEVAARVQDDTAKSATAWVDEQGANKVAVGDRVLLRPTDGIGAERTGVVRALGVAVAELPARFRQIPSEASFGRAVFLELDAAEGALPPLPGQAFETVFSAGPRGKS
ncbi:MAG: HlyD family efflux transporter periplasmic adaptor subunit [Deltaproteobacteria bacterium]|nr:HlyD family efflux transporter periplasmic adaptor subunit [Deltaproteobacteria bacterium]